MATVVSSSSTTEGFMFSTQVKANADTAVDNCIKELNSIVTELDDVILTGPAKEFEGDAYEGFKEFYVSKVKPIISDSLTAANNSLMSNIKKIMADVEQQFLRNVDPKLGEANRNPSAGE